MKKSWFWYWQIDERKVSERKHYRKIESSIKSLGWNCLYLVSSHIIIKWLKNDRFKSRISTEQIMKYFKREGSFEELVLREDKKEIFNKMFKSVLYDKKMIGNLEKKFGIKKNQLKH